MRRPVDLARLSPRRAFALGRLRAKRQNHREMRQLALEYDTELADLEHRLRELAVEYHKQRVEAALDEALVERMARPDMVLH